MLEFDIQTDPGVFEKTLEELGWLEEGEKVQAVSTAGEGNMNVVLRLRTNHRSLILKQSRPYVRKFPDIPAPLDRISVEHQFYQAADTPGLRDAFPGLLGYDPDRYVLLMEDLGDTKDMSQLYAHRKVKKGLLSRLLKILSEIHRSPVPTNYPENRKLRELNHQHIFVLPFEKNNGFPLDTIQKGLSELARPFKEDTGLKKRIAELGAEYLGPGMVLLHGDYYPGSWVETGGRVHVLDPEFSFAGFPEFDLGVMAGHLFMATMDPSMPEQCLQAYASGADPAKTRAIAGTEILRRLIGLAQLPLDRTLEEKAFMLEEARKLVAL